MSATPGPWKAYVNRFKPSWVRSFDTNKVWEICNVTHPEDARLIAAAPDLLEACDAILEIITDDEEPNEELWTDYYRNVVNKIRAAIKKARGEA